MQIQRHSRSPAARRALAVLLAALFCAQWLQAEHLHTAATPDHADCAICKIGNGDGASTAPIPVITPIVVAELGVKSAFLLSTTRPLQVRNRAPPAPSPDTI